MDRQVNFVEDIIPKIKSNITDSICATYKKLDTNRRLHWFELFGYDFMIDEEWNV